MPQLKPFTKSFANSADLVSLQQSRGLQIDDALGAEQYLDNIGYYRLSAYMYPLLTLPKEHHQYKPGSSFERVMELYRFDKKLRLLMFNEIEKCVLEMMTEGWPRAGALTHFRKSPYQCVA